MASPATRRLTIKLNVSKNWRLNTNTSTSYVREANHFSNEVPTRGRTCSRHRLVHEESHKARCRYVVRSLSTGNRRAIRLAVNDGHVKQAPPWLGGSDTCTQGTSDFTAVVVVGRRGRVIVVEGPPRPVANKVL